MHSEPSAMRVLIPVSRGRVSPLLDVARRFLLVNVQRGREVGRREVSIEKTGLVPRSNRIAQLDTNVLICGAISRPLEQALASEAVWVIPNTCGPVEQVLQAFRLGQLTERAYLMPGCSRRRHQAQGRHGGANPER
jgi:predicted Fe-Mo cluster-binding NifX family protein